MTIYQYGNTVSGTVTFLDSSSTPITFTTPPVATLFFGNDATTTTVTMTVGLQPGEYSYSILLTPNNFFGTYSIHCEGNDGTNTYTIIEDSFILGMFMYATILDILNSQVGIDRTQFTEAQLALNIQVAQELINNYVGFTFGPGGTIQEDGETIVDHDNNIFFSFRARNISAVTALSVWIPGIQPIALEPNYLDLIKRAGYGRYPVTVVHTNDAIYPMSVLGKSERLRYSATYTIDTAPAYNGGVPYVIQYAMCMIVKNLLLSQAQYNSSGVVTAGAGSSIAGFVSGKYSVKYASNMDTGKNRENKKLNTPDPILTPAIRAMLEPFAGNGQNTFI